MRALVGNSRSIPGYVRSLQLWIFSWIHLARLCFYLFILWIDVDNMERYVISSLVSFSSGILMINLPELDRWSSVSLVSLNTATICNCANMIKSILGASGSDKVILEIKKVYHYCIFPITFQLTSKQQTKQLLSRHHGVPSHQTSPMWRSKFSVNDPFSSNCKDRGVLNNPVITFNNTRGRKKISDVGQKWEWLVSGVLLHV